MSQQNKALVRKYFGELLGKGNMAVASEVLADDVVVQPPKYVGEALVGRAAVLQWFAALKRGFPDIHFTVGDDVGEGDKIASAFSFTATHAGEYMGLPATGRKVNLSGVDLFHISGGKIAKIEIYYDTLGLMTQLGVIPAMTGAKR